MGSWLYPILVEYFSQQQIARGQVDEAVQATMHDVLAKLAIAPDDPERFLGRVLGFANIQVRRMRSEERRRNARAAKLLEQHGRELDTPDAADQSLLGDEQRQLVFRHAAELPDIYRAAVLNALAQGSNHQLAERLGIPVNTARWRLWEGIRRLKQLIDDARVTRSPFRTPPGAV